MAVRDYSDFVSLYLNCDWAEVSSIVEIADGVEVGSGMASIPREWIDLLTDDPTERAKWLMKELRKELRK